MVDETKHMGKVRLSTSVTMVVKNPSSHRGSEDQTSSTNELESSSSNSDLVVGDGLVELAQPNLWGRGIMIDIKQTLGLHWFVEMTNFNQKTVSVALHVFVSAVGLTLTFGAVYGKETDNNIGTIESMLARAWGGIAYSLLGGMPLCIPGLGTPILAVSTAIYSISESLDVPYLTFNAWISLWLFGYSFLAGFFDLTRYLRLATRFTDEIFAVLISSLFVFNGIGNPFTDVGLLHSLRSYHKSHEDRVDDPEYCYLASGLLAVMLGLGTAWLTFFLRSFKNSSYFCNDSIRTSIHDLALSIAVVFSTLAKNLLFDEIETESLRVPHAFEPSLACCDVTCVAKFPTDCPTQESAFRTRSWFVDYLDLNSKSWVPFAAAGPALLVFVLLYIYNGITWHLINRKNHNLQHGKAYNWDLCLNGFVNFINGMFGLPWVVAVAAPSIIHLHALADKDENGNFIRVQETRLTLLLSHALIGLSILFLDFLRYIPVPVLYGIFLFMGLSSLSNLQFWNRFLLIFQQPSKYPSYHFLKHINAPRVHMFTLLQIVLFGLVFAVQNTAAIAIAFPLMVLLVIPVRKFLFPKLFRGWELLLLDGEDEAIQEWLDSKNSSPDGEQVCEDNSQSGASP